MINILKKRAIDAGILLLVGLIVAYAFIQWRKAGHYGELMAFIVLLGVFYHFRKDALREKWTPTPALAIVMSLGVFVSDFYNVIPIHLGIMSNGIRLLVIGILLLWLFFIFSYTKTILDGTFYLRHMANSLSSFGIGTWIAGASVCSMGIIMYLPYWIGIAYVIIVVNSLLWVVFAGVCIRNFMQLVNEKHQMINGIVLLSTVSTMSLAIDYSLVLDTHTFYGLLTFLICVGVLYYLALTVLILRSLLKQKWTLTDDWRNTNCILHGALSITGLAGVMTGVFSHWMAWGLWMIIMVIFIIVEGLEVARAITRVQRYGYRKALGTYHVSQWARNFTFSMLLAFTFKLPTEQLGQGSLLVLHIFSYLLFLAVLILLIYESYLYAKDETFLLDDNRVMQKHTKKLG